MKINGVDYIIEERNGNKYYYKKINGQKLELTSSELSELLKELEKMQQVEKLKEEIISKIKSSDIKSIGQIEKYIDDKGLNQYKEKIMEDIKDFLDQLTIDQIKNTILEQINSKQIRNEQELKDYINKYDLDNKDELLKYGIEELERFNLGLTPVEEFLNFIKDIYITKSSRNEIFEINFKAEGSGITKYFDVTIFTEIDGKKEKHPKSYYVKFDKNTTDKLIKPIVQYISLKGIENNDYERAKDDFINNRYNYNLHNNKKSTVNVMNVEEDYAKELKEEALKIEKDHGINNGEEVSEQIEKEYNQELYNAELEQEFTYEEIEDMKEKQMTPDEYRQLYKGGPKLVREKKDNKGYSLALPIFIITEFIAVLFILMQIILL